MVITHCTRFIANGQSFLVSRFRKHANLTLLICLNCTKVKSEKVYDIAVLGPYSSRRLTTVIFKNNLFRKFLFKQFYHFSFSCCGSHMRTPHKISLQFRYFRSS